MSVAIVTGSSGLIGSETIRFFHEKGFTVVGFDNNLCEYFFGAEASTARNTERLQSELENFTHHSAGVS
jgi:CDP-paratose 2-epimerase